MLAVSLAVLLTAAPRIAVMPVAPSDALPDKAAAALTDQLAAELRRQAGGEVLTPRDAPLPADKAKLAQGCSTDPGMAELAAAIGAERLVTAEVTRAGESLLLHARTLDARSARAVAVSDRRLRRGTPDDLFDALPGVVRELLRPPEAPVQVSDKLVIHYHRADGRYEASLYAWESFESGADLRRPVPVTWDPRVPTVEPDGHDDFGVLWILPAAKFRNGRVNFQIQQSGSWDECVQISWAGNPLHYSGSEPSPGPAQFWLLSEGREVWITVPSCELHPTLERALKAQQRRRPAAAPPPPRPTPPPRPAGQWPRF
jgi:hypothetical protein